MPTMQEIGEQAIQDLASSVAVKQAAFYAANGRYWQGATTPTDTPRFDAPTAPKATERISSEAKSYSDLGIKIPTRTPIRFSVDTYNGPQGHGYTVAAMTKDGDDMYFRVINVGPETGREQDWIKFPPR